jgi:Holliday junction DNA helicase RuvA
MINHLNGRLIEKNPTFAVIECGGVGYYVNISLYTYSKLGDSEACKIFTHLQINDDAHTLYGFSDEEERRLFRNLISVSGVGASTARMILSAMNPAEIQECIAREDAARLKSVKGIGEKTAMRIIIELKDKMKAPHSASGGYKSPVSGGVGEASNYLKIRGEALTALLTLGFPKPSVDKALDQLLKQQPSTTVEDLIRKALKTL